MTLAGGGGKMKTAYLYNDGDYTFFKVGQEIVKFRTSPYLEKYVEVKEYADGYLVVDLKLLKSDKVYEDYLDIKGIFNEIELDTSILSQVSEVIIKCKVPIMSKHTGLIPLRAYREEDIQKLVPIGRVYKDGVLYIDFTNMYGEKLITVLLTDVKTNGGLKWAEAAFPTAYKRALGLFNDMRDGFYDYQVRQGSKAPDAMYHDVVKNVMLPIHLFSSDEYGKEGVGGTYLFYNTRTTDVCLGVYDQDSDDYRLENGDHTSSYGLIFGIYRLIGVVLPDAVGV